MTRTVKDNALLLAGMAGYDPKDATSAKQTVPDFCADLDAGVGGLRIGVERDYFFYDGLIDEIRDAVESVIDAYRFGGRRDRRDQHAGISDHAGRALHHRAQ